VVEAEQVVGVVAVLERHQAAVGALAIGGWHTLGVVAVQEVDVGADLVGLDGGVELPCPGDLVLAGLVREPHRVDVEGVGGAAVGVGSGVLVDVGDRAAEVEQRPGLWLGYWAALMTPARA
jgi:hypothetical protein